MAIRLATQNAERLRFQWTVLGKKLSLGQLHGLTQGSCPKNKRAALEWLIESDVATCPGPTAVAAAASQMQRHRTHYATARKLLAKRLKRRGQQAVASRLGRFRAANRHGDDGPRLEGVYRHQQVAVHFTTGYNWAGRGWQAHPLQRL
jgi:hypothetical protein